MVQASNFQSEQDMGKTKEFLGAYCQVGDLYLATLEHIKNRVVEQFFSDEKFASMADVIALDGERAVVNQLLHFIRHPSDLVGTNALPFDGKDTIHLEFTVRYGRADMVAFHSDGSASVIEVKDGSTGLRSVVAGIGQVSSYACQLGLIPGSIKSIRRVLAWSSISQEEDDLVAKACESAGVVPLKLFATNDLRKAINEHVKSSYMDRKEWVFKQAGLTEKEVADVLNMPEMREVLNGL
jgi:hypothetical protein